MFKLSIIVKKHYKIHLFIFLLLSIHLFLYLPIDFISNVLAIAVCIGVVLHMKNVRFEFKRWMDVVLFITVNAYLTFAIFGYDLFLANIYFSHYFFCAFYYGLCIIWTCYVLKSFMDVMEALVSLKERLCIPTNEGYWKKWSILFGIMFALFLIWQIAYNPINISPDS